MVISTSLTEIVLASCVADIVQKAGLHPIDTVKARLQYSRATVATPGLKDHLAPSTRRLPIVADVREAWRLLAREPHPLRTLYSGLTPAVVGAIPTSVVYMPTYELCSAQLKQQTLFGTPLTPLAGVCTGVVSACIRVPMSVVKSQVQLGLHPDTTSAVQAIFNRSGPWGFFAGFRATVTLDVFYALVQFTVLEYLRSLAAILVVGEVTATHNALIGFLTGAITATATEPIDVIKTRLMAQRKGSEGPSKGIEFGYKGVWHGLSVAARNDGILSLWSGLLPRLLLKSLGSSLWYSVYMSTRSIIQGM